MRTFRAHTNRSTHPSRTTRPRSQAGRVAAVATLLLAGTFAVAGPAGSAERSVTTTADDGGGSLRAALDAANAAEGADVIVLGAGLEYVLSSCTAGELHSSNGPLTIVGNGSTIRQTCAGARVLRNTSDDLLTLRGVTLTGGDAPTDGGAVLSTAGPVTIVDSTVAANQAEGDGGGVWVDGATLTVDRSVVRDNRSFDHGGGLGVDGELRMTRTVVQGNSVTGPGAWGGGVYVRSGAAGARIGESSVSGNHADAAGGLGGGVYVDTGSLVVETSTVAGNTSAGDGAGVYAYYDTTLLRSTVSGNVAGGRGGGVFSYDPSLVVADSTVSGNSAVGTGGGIAAEGFDLDLDYVTLGANSSPGGAQVDLGGGALRSFASVFADSVGGPACAQVVGVTEGHNYEQTTDSCGLRSASDVVDGVPTGLSALANDGGPTQTQVPASNSPLLDAILAGSPGCTGADQRGVVRPQGGACDIGAVELVVVASPPPGSPLAFVG